MKKTFLLILLICSFLPTTAQNNLFEWVDGKVVCDSSYIILHNDDTPLPSGVNVYTYKTVEISSTDNNYQYSVISKGTYDDRQGNAYDVFSVIDNNGYEILSRWGYEHLFSVDFLTNSENCTDFFLQIPLGEDSFALVFAGILYDHCDEAGEMIIVVINKDAATVVYDGRAFVYSYTPAPDFSIEFVDNIRFVNDINDLFDEDGKTVVTDSQLTSCTKYKIWREGNLLKYKMWK